MGFVFNEDLTRADKMLWLSVLRRAVYDYVLYKGVGQYHLDWQRAYQYVFGNKRPENGLTFEEVCEVFNWEPDYIRRLATTLNRADIKKLEVNGFLREDEPRKAGHWIIAKCSCPWFPPYGVSDAVKKKYKLKKVLYRRTPKRAAPLVQWSSAVA